MKKKTVIRSILLSARAAVALGALLTGFFLYRMFPDRAHRDTVAPAHPDTADNSVSDSPLAFRLRPGGIVKPRGSTGNSDTDSPLPRRKKHHRYGPGQKEKPTESQIGEATETSSLPPFEKRKKTSRQEDPNAGKQKAPAHKTDRPPRHSGTDNASQTLSEENDNIDTPLNDRKQAVLGCVVTPEGNPADRAIVKFLAPVLTEQNIPPVETDSRGIFLIDGLPSALSNVTLKAEDAGYVSLPVQCETRTEYGDEPWVEMTLQGAAGLTVTAVDTKNEPLEDTKIFVQVPGTEEIHSQGLTDAEGRIVFDHVPAGEITILAEKQGYSSPGYETDTGNEQNLELKIGEIRHVSMMLREVSAASGKVLDYRGRPVENVGVYLKKFSANGLDMTAHTSPMTRTDYTGAFTLYEIPDGSVELCAAAQGIGISQWTELPERDSGMNGFLTLSLLTPHTLRGTVFNLRHERITGATVTCRLTAPEYAFMAPWETHSSTIDGTYHFDGIPADECILEAVSRTGEIAQRELTPGQITAMQPIDLTVAEPGARSFSGIVLDSYGKPLGDATVRLHRDGVTPTPGVSTQTNGNFLLPLSGPAPWTVSASARDHAPAYTTVDEQKLSTEYTFTLGRGTTLAVDLVTDVPAEQLPGKTLPVTITMKLETLPAIPFSLAASSTIREDTGTVFVMDHLCPGDYICEVTAEKMSTATIEVTVHRSPAEQILREPVILRLGSTIHGRTLGKDNTPISAAVRLDGCLKPATVSDQDGLFSLEAVPPGKTVLRAQTATHFGLSREITLQQGGQSVGIGQIIIDSRRTDPETTDYVRIGIGIGWRKEDNWWLVNSLKPDTSAAAAGIIPGDRLIEVDRINAYGWSVETLQNAVNGKLGTNVDLLFERGDTRFEVRLQREIQAD